MSSFTQENLDALEQAIAEGALTVRFADKEITYQSLEQMLKVRRIILRSLGKGQKRKRIRSTFRKGF